MNCPSIINGHKKGLAAAFAGSPITGGAIFSAPVPSGRAWAAKNAHPQIRGFGATRPNQSTAFHAEPKPSGGCSGGWKGVSLDFSK